MLLLTGCQYLWWGRTPRETYGLFVCLFVRSFVLFVLIVLFVITGVADGHDLSLAGPPKSTNGRVPCGPPIRAAARPIIIAVIAQLVARRSHS